MSSSSNNKPLKAGVWYTVSNIAIRGISILTAPIFTRLLSTSDYGLVSNFVSWQNILGCFFSLGLSYSIGRAKIDFKEDFDGYISSVQTLNIFVGLFLMVAILPFLGPLAVFMEMDKALVISMAVMLIFSPSLDYYQTKLRFEYRYKENVAIAIAHTLGVVAISIVLILLSDYQHKYAGRIFGNIIPLLLLSIMSLVIIWKNGRKLIAPTYWKYALHLSLPMVPHGLAMIVLSQIDRIMIVKMDGTSAAGIYSFGYSYAIILSVVSNAISGAWTPWLYETIDKGDYNKIVGVNKKINLGICIVAFIFIALGPEAIMILGAKEFWVAKWMVVPVIMGTLAQFFYSLFANMEIYCKKTYITAIGSVGAAIINYVLNLIFIPRYGYIAAAYTTMAGYVLLLLYHWFAFKMIFKEHIYAESQIAGLLILTTTGAFLFMMYYDAYFVRYIALLLIVILYCYFNRESLKFVIDKYLLKTEKDNK